ncbi:MAG: sensor domain-containing diguanylate cyclase, partial [Candidatus Aminicenantales bacterium]
TMVDALKDARDTLEKRVDDRTRELQAEISERKRVEEALRKSEEDFRSMIENLGEGVGMISPDEEFVFANVAADIIFGEPPDGLIGKSLKEFLSSEQFALVRSQTERRRAGERGHYEMEILRPDGARRILLMTAMPRFGARGEYGGELCVFTDITDRKTAETELRDANDKLMLNIGRLEQRASEMALLSEFNDSLQACNNEVELFAACGRYGQKLFPDQRGEIYIFKESRNLLDVTTCWGEVCPAVNYMAPEDCWAVRRSKPHLASDPGVEMLCRHVEAAGPVTPYLCIPLIAGGRLNGLLHIRFPGPDAVAGILQKTQRNVGISEHKTRLAQNFSERIGLALDNLRLRLELKRQSVRDPLTGLFNRRYMEETLSREVARSERNKAPLGIIMMDIDKFKNFNDMHGHEAGDIMLRALARFLMAGVRKEDIVCRFGGEEFIVILPGASLDVASERARTLLDEVISIRAEFGGIELGPISLSLGVAVFPDHGRTGGEVVQAADKALLTAKREGRGRVVVAS